MARKPSRKYLTIRQHIRGMLDRRLNWLLANSIIKRKPEYVMRKSLIEAGDELRYMLEAESVEEERGKLFIAEPVPHPPRFSTCLSFLKQGLHTLKC